MSQNVRASVVNSNGQQPLRIAMLARVVYPIHGFGGIERHVFHLVTHLARLGVHVTLYVQPPTAELYQTNDGEYTLTHEPTYLPGVASVVFLRYDYTTPVLRPNSILGRQINYPHYSWQLGCAVATAARRGAYDIIHAQGLCALGYGWIRQRDPLLKHIPFIANPHGLEEYRTPDKRKWFAYAPFRLLYSYGTRCADRAIATDACTQDDVPHYLGVDPQRVAVIPSAIDVDECLGYVDKDERAQLRERFRLADSQLRLLSVGRLELNKGYHILIEALARLRDRLPANWQWLLVGQGKERPALEALVQQHSLTEHVIFVGQLNDTELHSLYEEIDIVVHPTLYEGSSLVTLEGMIHRRPLIASAVGGIPDKVFDNRNGFLVRPGDIDDLITKLIRVIEQRSCWAEWGEASVEIVRTTFDWPVVARRTLTEYKRMLSERRLYQYT